MSTLFFRYRPQTRDTKAAYEALLAFVQKEMGDQPHDVIRSAAGEIIEILKDDSFRTKEKQKEVESLFRKKQMDEATFSRLVDCTHLPFLLCLFLVSL